MSITIGVLGNFGRSNAGDEAIAASLTRLILLQVPQATVAVSRPGRYWPEVVSAWRLGTDGEPMRLPDGTARTSVGHGLSWGRGLSALFIGGGGLLMDLHRWAVPKYLQGALIARAHGVPVVNIGISIGPLSTQLGTISALMVLRLARVNIVRDPESLAWASDRVPRGRCVLAPDLVFGLAGGSAPREVSDVHEVGISVLPWGDSKNLYRAEAEDAVAYRAQCVALVRGLLQERSDTRVSLLCFDWKRDVVAANGVVDELGSSVAGRVRIVSTESWRELYSAVAGLDLLIATRLHSLIFGLHAGVPTLPIIYQQKVRSVIEQIGLGGRGLALHGDWGTRALAETARGEGEAYGAHVIHLDRTHRDRLREHVGMAVADALASVGDSL